jgi:hypothetical protein
VAEEKVQVYVGTYPRTVKNKDDEVRDALLRVDE